MRFLKVMGQFYSRVNKTVKISDINSKNAPTIPIKILNTEAKIENNPTVIDEKSPAVLKYKTPHFRASATVCFPPIDADEVWKIGWIQACTYMEFYNRYGNLGYSSWEFPELLTGEKPMISDSDGRNYPWYGSNREVALIEGPQNEYQNYTVSMNDNFHPHVTWDIPTSTERVPRLTSIKRDQIFYTWLVAMDVLNGDFIVLKTVRWRMNLEINVDPSRKPGQRAQLISNPEPEQPRVLKRNKRIPNCALYPVNANSAQTLIWRPFKSKPEIVVAPKYVRISDDGMGQKFLTYNFYA